MSTHVRGFAVRIDRQIDIRTVSGTERAAKVNFLATTARQQVTTKWTDEMIAEKFEALAPHYGAVLVPVTVTETPR